MSLTDFKKEDLRSALMEEGFYPENLPPVFRVEGFHDASVNLGFFNETQSEREKPFGLARYEESKRGGQRRVFSVPNPLFFVDCADFVASHRKKLAGKMAKSKISKSTPEFKFLGKRAISISSFSDFNSFRKKELSSSKYIVKIDISRFYHSIYTHSIPWALHGKSASKLNRKVRSQEIYGNMLDYLIRQAQDQQTIGIPVGPDISRIVGELISCAIDEKFFSDVGNFVNGARLVDDVYLGADTPDQAESYLSSYREAIKYFELDINENKTRIFDASRDIEPFWPVSIRRELEGYANHGLFPAGNQKRSDLTLYLDEIIRICVRDNDDGVIRYALRKMDDLKLWRTYWEQLEPFLVRSSINFPHSVDYVARVVAWMRRRHQIDERLWARVANRIVAHHAKLGHDSEVAWACWLLKEIGGKIDSRLAELVLTKCGPLTCLLILDLETSGLISGRFRRRPVYERIDDHPMRSNDWLLSYEAERLFGYRLKTKNRSDYGQIAQLIDEDVSFYDNDALPYVFQGFDDDDLVDEALEDRSGTYDDEDEGFEDDEDDDVGGLGPDW